MEDGDDTGVVCTVLFDDDDDKGVYWVWCVSAVGFKFVYVHQAVGDRLVGAQAFCFYPSDRRINQKRKRKKGQHFI